MTQTYSFDFTRGVELTPQEIEKYKQEVLRNLKEGKPYSYVATGNCIVWGTKSGSEYHIRVCTNYQIYEFRDEGGNL